VQLSNYIHISSMVTSTIHDLVTKFETTGSVQNKKHTRRRTHNKLGFHLSYTLYMGKTDVIQLPLLVKLTLRSLYYATLSYVLYMWKTGVIQLPLSLVHKYHLVLMTTVLSSLLTFGSTSSTKTKKKESSLERIFLLSPTRHSAGFTLILLRVPSVFFVIFAFMAILGLLYYLMNNALTFFQIDRATCLSIILHSIALSVFSVYFIFNVINFEILHISNFLTYKIKLFKIVMRTLIVDVDFFIYATQIPYLKSYIFFHTTPKIIQHSMSLSMYLSENYLGKMHEVLQTNFIVI
ncbi:hypothetical protein L9F63_012655, partial [Diploptera punctata]